MKKHLELGYEADLGIGSMVVGEGGIILDTGPLAASIFGYTPEELIGTSVENLIPETTREQHIKDRQTYWDNPEPRRMGTGREVIALKKDGSQVPIEAALNYSNGAVYMSIIDISVRNEIRDKQESALIEKIDDLREKIKKLGIKM